MTLTEAMDEATIRLGISKEQSIEAQRHATDSMGLTPNFVIKEGHEEAVLEALSVWLKGALQDEDKFESVLMPALVKGVDWEGGDFEFSPNRKN